LLFSLIEKSFKNPLKKVKGIGKESLVKKSDIYLAKILYPNYKVKFVVGFGGSDDEVNVRVCSYLMPAILDMQNFVDLGLEPPCLEITHGASIAKIANDLNPEGIDRNKAKTILILKKFVRDFYPHLEQFCFFSEIDDCTGTERISKRVETLKRIPEVFEDSVEKILELLRNNQFSDAELAMAADWGKFLSVETNGCKSYKALFKKACKIDGFEPIFRNLIDIARLKHALSVLANLGNKHCVKNNDLVLYYAAVHPDHKAFGDIADLTDKGKFHAVIKYGGTGEGSFNVVQEYLAKFEEKKVLSSGKFSGFVPVNTTFGASYAPVHEELTVGGNPPVYYKAGEAEISLSGVREFASFADLKAHYRGYLPKAYSDLCVFDEEQGQKYFEFLQSIITK
jgi:hypothetical protein